jgi:hypothetical protein
MAVGTFAQAFGEFPITSGNVTPHPKRVIAEGEGSSVDSLAALQPALR